MKTPRAPTRVVTGAARGEAPAAVLQPWGEAPARLVVEAPAGRGTPVRALLKSRVADDYPQGKAVARARYFGVQRGLAEAQPTPAARSRETGTAPARAPLPTIAPRAVRANTAPAATGFKAAAALPAWREIGPTLVPHGQTYGSGPGASPAVAGRCSGVVVDRADPRHLVACSSGGGLWGSHDQGNTWAPLTDRQPTLVMGAIAQSVSAPNVMYAATGDGDGSIPYGMGLLRSSDGGRTWDLVPASALTGIGSFDLAIHPTDPLSIWVATSNGLFATANGGSTVRQQLPGTCWSVSVNPTNPQELLAGTDTGLMRSADSGATWSRLGLPGTSASTAFARLEVGHALSDPGVVWVAGCVGKTGLLWRRAAAGGAFAAEAVPGGMDFSQAWYDWCLAVSPVDPNRLFWGAIETYRGVRGTSGTSWVKVSSRPNGDSIHPDQHAVVYDPSDARVVYACNDGGLFRSPDLGEHWQSLNPGLGITEFEYLAQLESDPGWLLGGTQDNGTLANAGARRWDQIALGDGGDCAAVDRGAASICYHSYYDMPLERAAATGASAFAWTDVTPPAPKGYAALFYPPVEASGSIVAKAGATVWVSENDGGDWAEVALPGSGGSDPDLASAMAIVGTTTILVGTVAGKMYRLVRGAAGWAGATVTTLARPVAGYISDIAVIGTTGKTIWVGCSRLSGSHVFRSTNGGTSWTDRSGNLPATAVNALVVDPKNSRRLFIGTDRGVWRTTNSGTSWTTFSNGLPNVIVGDLILHAGTRVLRAGTRSRGAWEVTV